GDQRAGHPRADHGRARSDQRQLYRRLGERPRGAAAGRRAAGTADRGRGAQRRAGTWRRFDPRWAISLAVGFVLVIAFMAVFYGLFGWFANVCLVVNLVLMLGIMSLLQATLTLPGMAGILLTLGMAVDANILINERIREEQRLGRPPLSALEHGFTRAYNTIFDSNATAFLPHVMLFVFCSGPVKGLAGT